MAEEYNAADRKAVRRRIKEARQALAERQIVVLNLMSSPAGRSYMHERLVRCHIFSSSFNASSLGMAFAEGERNVGLQDLNDVMAFAPDQYIQMMREANDRSNNDRPIRSAENGRRDDTGSEPEAGAVISDYDPGNDDDDRADDSA